MINQPALHQLLKLIFGNCKSVCGVACSCRRVGLFSITICGACSGDNFQNSPTVIDEEKEKTVTGDELNITAVNFVF